MKLVYFVGKKIDLFNAEGKEISASEIAGYALSNTDRKRLDSGDCIPVGQNIILWAEEA